MLSMRLPASSYGTGSLIDSLVAMRVPACIQQDTI
jgi:hypothetical protein